MATTNYDGNRAMNGNNLYTFWVTIKALILGWLGAKQDTITGGASTITSDNLDASRALISNSNGKVAVSSVTSSQLGYLANVTSDVQGQLNSKEGTLVFRNNISKDTDGHVDVPTATTTSSGAKTAGVMSVGTADITSSSLENYDNTSPALYSGQLHIRKADSTNPGVVTLAQGTFTEATVGVATSAKNYPVGKNSSGQLVTGIGILTATTPGVAMVFNNTSVTDEINSVTTTAGRYYGVQKKSDGTLVVNVPWTDTKTDISGKQDKIKVGTATAGNITTISAGTNIAIDISSSTATIKNTYSYTLPTAGTSTKGGVKSTTLAVADLNNYTAATGVYSEQLYVRNADSSNMGVMKLYTAVDQSTTGKEDGTLTLKAIEYRYAPLASPDFTGTPTISGNAIATQSYVDTAITGAETFKGTLASNDALKAYGNFKAGWYWRVALPSGTSSATIAGQTVENGDMVYCTVTHNHTAGADITDANFNVVNTNIVFLTDSEIAAIVNAAS